MSEVAVQASFNAGEWSPHLNARVDMQKYKSGAALLENFFVDYRVGQAPGLGPSTLSKPTSPRLRFG